MNPIRIAYIVCYDISDQDRLRRVHKKILGFGDPLQYSVFFCCLNDSEKILMKESLSPLINHKEDQVLWVRLGPAGERVAETMETLGRRSRLTPQEERRTVIV